MLEGLQRAIRSRAIFVFLVIHLGLILGIYGLARISMPNGWDETSLIFLGALVCLYGGILAAVFFIVWPLLPWLRRVQRIEHWSERLIRDLPILLQHLPQIIEAVQKLRRAWQNPPTNSRHEP